MKAPIQRGCLLLLVLFFAASVQGLVVSSSTESFWWPPNREIVLRTVNNTDNVVQVSIVLPNSYKYEVELEPAQKRAGVGVLQGFVTALQQGLFDNFEHEDVDKVFFKITLRDSMCDNSYGPKAFTDAVKEGVHVLFGPSCEYALAPVARMIKFYKLPLLTAGGFAFDFNKPKGKISDEFHLLTKTGYSFEAMASFIFDFFKKTQWQRTRLVYKKNARTNWSGNNTCTQFMSAVVKVAQERNIFFEEIKLDSTDQQYPNDSKTMLENELGDYSIVILCASPEKVRDILLAADSLGLVERGEYVFFNVELFTSNERSLYQPWYDPKAPDEENARARKAFEAVLTVTASSSSQSVEYGAFANAVKQLSKEKFNYIYEEPVNNFVANFHDAVLLYATALQEAIEEKGLSAKSDGDLIVEKMWNRTISGVTGNVSINANGDRTAVYELLDMDPVTGTFQVVAVYHGLSKSLEMVDNASIHWPNRDGPPRDMPECGFDGSLCINDKPMIVYIILSTVLSVVVIVLATLSLFIYRYAKSEFQTISTFDDNFL